MAAPSIRGRRCFNGSSGCNSHANAEADYEATRYALMRGYQTLARDDGTAEP